MKLLLDTAHLPDTTIARDGGILDGVTTNPSPAAVEAPFHRPPTDIGMARFNADWEAYQRALAAKRG